MPAISMILMKCVDMSMLNDTSNTKIKEVDIGDRYKCDFVQNFLDVEFCEGRAKIFSPVYSIM